MFAENAILVTGPARSGFWAAAGLIEMGGVFGGETFGPRFYHPKGMFVNQYIPRDYETSYGTTWCGSKGSESIAGYTDLS
jgi:hypothetical protein